MDSDGAEPPKTIQNDPKMIQKSMDSDGAEPPKTIQKDPKMICRKTLLPTDRRWKTPKNVKKPSYRRIGAEKTWIFKHSKNAPSGRKLTRRRIL